MVIGIGARLLARARTTAACTPSSTASRSCSSSRAPSAFAIGAIASARRGARRHARRGAPGARAAAGRSDAPAVAAALRRTRLANIDAVERARPPMRIILRADRALARPLVPHERGHRRSPSRSSSRRAVDRRDRAHDRRPTSARSSAGRDRRLRRAALARGDARHRAACPASWRRSPYRARAGAQLRFGRARARGAVQGVPAVQRLLRRVSTRPATRSSCRRRVSCCRRAGARCSACGRGDRLTVEVLEGRRPGGRVTVADLFETYIGLARLHGDATPSTGCMRERPRSGAVTSARRRRVARSSSASSKRMPAVTLGDDQPRGGQELRRHDGEEPRSSSRASSSFFACTLAFGVVYNSARIALSERGRELATPARAGLHARRDLATSCWARWRC